MVSSNPTDQTLWNQVLGNDTRAFETIVSRHQAAVSAVSFSCLGDYVASEDIAQETFLVAWQAREKLESAASLRAWLCGIARNLAKNYLRTSLKRQEQQRALAQDQRDTAEPATVESRSMLAEEQALVWDTLAALDETYREPLVLFYREGQSITAIASALDISEAAAKQRLSRGRKMLRASVANLVGQTLEETRPDHQFTAAVMASIGASGAAGKAISMTTAASVANATKAATASKAAAGLATVGSGGLLGIAGGLLGAAGGLLGGWFGTWLPAQMADSLEEKRIIEGNGRMLMRVAIVFTVWIFMASLVLTLPNGWMFGVPLLLIGMLVFTIRTIVVTLRMQRTIKHLKDAGGDELTPNNTKTKELADRLTIRMRGRVYRSNASLFGLPLIDIQVADPSNRPGQTCQPKTAKGWIAIGDRAYGFLAVGGVAAGCISVGGVSAGLVSIGGLALGIVALGGAGVGLLSLGGLAIGLFACGGAAIGWDAAGGGAIAWNCACGGGAIGYTSAMGGGAWALNYAVGGAAVAEQANTEAARTFIEQQWAYQAMQQMQSNSVLITACVVMFSLVWVCMVPLMYQRASQSEPEIASEDGVAE